MAVTQNAQAVAQKWRDRLAASTTQIQAGVQAVTVAPGQAAAAAVNRYLQGVQAAVASGKWQQRVSAVSLQSWQNAMINKGIPRIASGAAAGMPVMQSFMSVWLPYVAAGVQQLANTPRGDLAQNTQRAVAMINYNAAFKRNQ